MACDRAEDRTLLLSLGLFGVPAGREQRDRETQGAEEGNRTESEKGAAR